MVTTAEWLLDKVTQLLIEIYFQLYCTKWKENNAKLKTENRKMENGKWEMKKKKNIQRNEKETFTKIDESGS